MRSMGTLTDVAGKRYSAIRQWDNGYKLTFVDEETGAIPSRIDCGTHWLVLRDDGVWVTKLKEMKEHDER